MVNHRDFHRLMIDVENAQLSCRLFGNFVKDKHFTARCLSKIKENLDTHKDLHKYVHSSLLHNNHVNDLTEHQQKSKHIIYSYN